MTSMTTDETWSKDHAAHLARRAGFGATPDEIAHLAALGREAAVAHFVDFPDVDEELEKRMREEGGELVDFDAGEGSSLSAVTNRARRWWLYRMAHGQHPLQEKLTLLWHDHFACQQSKIIRLPQYFEQNQLFRRNAAGSFRTLVREVSSDPGMLIYLDNRLNEKANPNENWGRELLELFTLGVDNGYTQKDVYEVSRVFTGWSTPDKNSDEFVYNAQHHDETDKLVFGETLRGRGGDEGMQEGYEAIERILDKPECADYIAYKLLSWFVTHQPSAERIAEYGAILRENEYSIRETLRVLFSSEWFYAPENRLNYYKTPVDFVISAARLLGVQNVHRIDLPKYTTVMGMSLFEPPSVAGWEHGETWVNSGAIVHRFNFALDVSELAHTRRRVTDRVDECSVLNLDAISTAQDDGEVEHGALVDAIAQRLLQRPLAARDAVIAYLDDADGRLPSDMKPRSRRRAKTRAAIHLILTTPEFAFA